MRHRAFIVSVAVASVAVAAVVVTDRLTPLQGQGRGEPRFAAVPSEKGGQDTFGGYEIVPNWPKPISSLPGNEKWTWGAGQSVFAESPDRVFILQRGMLPNLPRPMTIKLPQLGPGIEFPNFRLPWRDATVASPPGALERDGKPGDDSDVGKNGVEFNWSHCIVVVDRNGNHIEDWTQWDKMLRRPHAVYISPYDSEKNVWIVDDYRHSIFKFSHDGKKLLQTIGEPNVHASDDKHFYRPTFMAWLPDGTFFVSDGYANTRVVKFDKNGKYLMTWGEPGTNAGRGGKQETRPGYFNNVHGIAVDPQTRQVFVNDRANHRAQVFDENGKFLREWSFGPPPSDIHLFIIDSNRNLWAADRGTSKMLKYDLNGNFLYSWGTWGDFAGGMWGVHGLSVDNEGNFYTAEVDSGRAQKYRPRAGANPVFLIGKAVNPGWK